MTAILKPATELSMVAMVPAGNPETTEAAWTM